MLSPRIEKFLQAQKERMIQLDESEGVHQDENSPKYYDEQSKKVLDGRTVIYENIINWLRSRDGYSALWEEFHHLEQTLSEDTLSTAAPSWVTKMLPLVRRSYNKLFSQDLISIQPISQPATYIYYLNKRYTNTTAEVTALDRMDEQKPQDYAASSETGLIREIQMDLERKLVETVTTKLKADYTLEAMQDWRSQYKLEVEAEMVTELGDEIARELDRRILYTLIAGAGNVINWNPEPTLAGDKTSTLNRRAYSATIFDSLVDARAWIMDKVPGADDPGVQWWAVMGSLTWARFAKLENYNMSPLVVDTKAAIGHRFEGTINNIFKCYVSGEMPKDYILVGMKKDWKTAPGFFSPYIPLYVSPRIVRNDDFSQFARGVLSRYAYGIIPSEKDGTTTNKLVLISLAQS
jgi:hypothetical protein